MSSRTCVIKKSHTSLFQFTMASFIYIGLCSLKQTNWNYWNNCSTDNMPNKAQEGAPVQFGRRRRRRGGPIRAFSQVTNGYVLCLFFFVASGLLKSPHIHCLLTRFQKTWQPPNLAIPMTEIEDDRNSVPKVIPTMVPPLMPPREQRDSRDREKERKCERPERGEREMESMGRERERERERTERDKESVAKHREREKDSVARDEDRDAIGRDRSIVTKRADTGIDRDRARADTSPDHEVRAAGRRNPEDPTENAPRRRLNEQDPTNPFFSMIDERNAIYRQRVDNHLTKAIHKIITEHVVRNFFFFLLYKSMTSTIGKRHKLYPMCGRPNVARSCAHLDNASFFLSALVTGSSSILSEID